METNDNNKDAWLTVLLGVLAIFTIKAIFENDNSKIVSKKGKKILSDKDKMDEINLKIKSLDPKDKIEEIFI